MYAKNISTFLLLLVKDGKLLLNRDDEIVRETLVTHGGQVDNQRIQETLKPARAAAGAGRGRED